MKKRIILVCCLALVACGGLNKNTVSYQMSKYDTAQYYTVAGDGMTKKDASSRALANMKQELVEHTLPAGQDIVKDLVANAQVEKVWRDKESNTKRYYALAVLPRAKANSILEPLLNEADAQLTGLAGQFTTPANPLADLKVAYKMQPIVQRRNALDELYQFVQANHASYTPATFAPYKDIFKEKMGAVLVGVSVEGVESSVLTSYVIDALNKMGLGVVEESDPGQTLSVKITTEVDNYSSKKIDGLIWCSSGATVNLVDAQRQVTFSSFTVHERAGTSRLEDSLRQSMQSVGEQAAQQISIRLENYLKMK